MSTPATRAKARDFWNRPGVVKVAKAFDWAMGIVSVLALAILGSVTIA